MLRVKDFEILFGWTFAYGLVKLIELHEWMNLHYSVFCLFFCFLRVSATRNIPSFLNVLLPVFWNRLPCVWFKAQFYCEVKLKLCEPHSGMWTNMTYIWGGNVFLSELGTIWMFSELLLFFYFCLSTIALSLFFTKYLIKISVKLLSGAFLLSWLEGKKRIIN